MGEVGGHRSHSVTDEKPGVIEPVLRGDASCRSAGAERTCQELNSERPKKHLRG